MSILVGMAKDPRAAQSWEAIDPSGSLLRDLKGFLRTIAQGDLIGAEEQLDEFKRLPVDIPEVQSAIRQSETLLKMQLFLKGIRQTPLEESEEEEKEFLSFLTTQIDTPCLEIEEAAERVLAFLQLKKLVGDLMLFSQKFIELQNTDVKLSSFELSSLKEELSALKGRVQPLNWSGKEDALSQIGKLERAMPTLEKSGKFFTQAGFSFTPVRQIIQFFSQIFTSKPPILGSMPIGIPNEGSSCFLASAVQLILKDPVLEEALIQDWLEGGEAREFGEFLFFYREAQKEGKTTIRGIGKLRDALCRISKNDGFSSGQWDANEVLRTLISDEKSPLFQRLLEKGYFVTETVRRFYEPPLGAVPLEGGDLLYDPERSVYYSERKTLRPAQIEVELSLSDAGKPIGELIGAVWSSSLEGSEPGNYLMQDQQTLPCTPLVQRTEWSNTAPHSVLVSLKRWAYAGAGIKIASLIQVKEIEEIPIGDAKVLMKLAGYTLHSGSTGGGHWISYSSERGRYTRNDDGRVTEVSQEEFLIQAQGASDLIFCK